MSQYPYFFQDTNGDFNAYFVVGEDPSAHDSISVTDMATNMFLPNYVPIPLDSVKTSDEISSLEKNMILVGRRTEFYPSQLSHILDQLEPYRQLNPGEAYIESRDYQGYEHLIVTGYDESDVRKAARVLSEPSKYALSGTKILVTGTSLDDLSINVLE